MLVAVDDDAVSLDCDCPRAKEAVNNNTNGDSRTIFAKLAPVEISSQC